MAVRTPPHHAQNRQSGGYVRVSYVFLGHTMQEHRTHFLAMHKPQHHPQSTDLAIYIRTRTYAIRKNQKTDC